MKKILGIISLLAVPSLAFSQSVTGANTISQSDLRGTARYMSMAGAFGALGGDLTAITQNPGGIGIYRSNEIGLSFGLDMDAIKSESDGVSLTEKQTRFNLNNVGAVFTMKLYNNTLPNLNFGFAYNKTASFNRRFKGFVPSLRNSLSNYIAGLSNAYGLNEADVSYGSNYDPYNPPAGHAEVPWLAVMGYYGFLTDPDGNVDNPRWYGQYEPGITSGSGYFDVREKGSVDDYNIVIGGNINNVVFWGMNFDITSVDYRIQSIWSESLDNAYVFNPNTSSVGLYNADWALYDNYRLYGTGFKFNIGLIIKPIQELRLGIAFHTPTYYNLSETYYDEHLDYKYPFKTESNSVWANDGYSVGNSFNFNTPWKVLASVAGVIGNSFILSADYEWAGYNTMKYSDANVYGFYDPWYDWDYPYGDWGWGGYYSPAKKSKSTGSAYRESYYNPNDYANAKIREIYRNTNTIRLGAEYRVLPSLSIRAGYSFVSSPVRNKVKQYQVDVPGTGIMTNYSLDNTTNYVTAGLGWKHNGFYADLAYVYKYQTSEYFPYSPDIDNPMAAVKTDLTTSNNSLVLSLGYKF